MEKNCWESVSPVPSHRKTKVNKLMAEVYHGKVLISLNLEKDGITWEENNVTNFIKYHCMTNVKRSKSKPEICINYIARSSNSILEFQSFKIKFQSHGQSENWSKSISKQLKKKFNRIKSLVIIIDTIPKRCKLDGNSLFKEHMSAIIQELKIAYVIKEIKSDKDIDDLEQFYDSMKSVDGIVIIGGDETASSIISNIINLYQTNNCFVVKHVPVPFIIIPTGYHNDISRSIWRDESIQNIFLNIFLCKTFQADVLSITKDDKKKVHWGFNCHYGYYSVLEKCRLENNDMKESFISKKALKKLRGLDCAIQYKLAAVSLGLPTDDMACNKNCSSCNMITMSVTNTPIYNLNSSNQSASTDLENYETIKDTNDISWIVVNTIPCRNEAAENAFAPACHFNDGSADLIFVKSANINDMKKYLKCQRFEGAHLKLPFVDAYRIEEIHVTHKMNSSWTNNNDKFILESPMSKNNKNNIIVIEDTDTSSTNDEDGKKEEESSFSKPTPTESITKSKKINKLLRPVMKACKDLTRSTQASLETDTYKKPNMLESDKNRERKAEKLKMKNIENRKFEASWMLDYNFIGEVSSSINIRVHSGIVSFFGDGMD